LKFIHLPADNKATPLIAGITISSLIIRTHAAKCGGVPALNKHQENFINKKESEAFRKKIASTKK